MSKVNAHYERIDPRNGVRNSVLGVDSIVMCIVKVHSERIDHRNGGFSLRFGGQSVHNAHLLCSCNWGKWQPLKVIQHVSDVVSLPATGDHSRPEVDYSLEFQQVAFGTRAIYRQTVPD